MRRFTLLFSGVVFAALAVAFFAARMRTGAREVPSFAPPGPLAFRELEPPFDVHSVRGRVVDIEGRPVAGVSLYFRSNDMPFWGETDELGEFLFEGTGAGEVQVALLRWGHPPRMQAVTPDQEVELVIAPESPPPELLPDSVASPLGGRVASPLGRSFWDPQGYELILVPRRSPAEFGGAVERRVRCDSGGAFRIPELAHASYDVHVVPAWAEGTMWPDLVAPAYSKLDHGPESPASVALPLRCGALEAALLDSGGKPLEGALVILADAADPRHLWPPQASDPAGRFRFLDLPPGEYLLTVRAGEGALVDRTVHVANAQVSRPDLEPIAIRKR